MLRLDRMLVQGTIGTLLSKKRQLQWLVELVVRAERVVHFGCSSGGETLALMWALEASEAVGVDKSEQSIHQAQSTLTNTQATINLMQRRLRYYPREIPEDDKAWWETVPSFFKQELLQERFHVSFVVQDITKPTGLQSDYFDVAFCDFVLHHIWLDPERRNAQEDTQFAIGEMARVVRPGGAVAAFELIQYLDEPRLDFRPLFEQAGLKLVHTKEMEVNGLDRHGVTAEYLCNKPIY